MMTKESIMIRLNDIFKEVFDDDTLVITESTCSENIEDWDSLSHLELVSSIESEFKIKFKLDEMKDMINVGQMCKYIVNHIDGNK